MVTSFQKPKNGGCNISARIDQATYDTMLGLASAAGYEDVSSFVREAVLHKCLHLAKGMASMYEDRISAYKSHAPLSV
jgi:hypothetical protein